MRILVLDDDPAFRAPVRKLLESDGHDVTECGTALEAADLFAHQRFDLALLDWELHTRLTGADVAQQAIRKHGVPVIIVTGHSVHEITEVWRHGYPLAGVLTVVEKPVAWEDTQGRPGLRTLVHRIDQSREDTPARGTKRPT